MKQPLNTTTRGFSGKDVVSVGEAPNCSNVNKHRLSEASFKQGHMTNRNMNEELKHTRAGVKDCWNEGTVCEMWRHLVEILKDANLRLRSSGLFKFDD